nr:hypothetical protein GZ17F1_30 [uncultured archaeon GZfos17F1]
MYYASGFLKTLFNHTNPHSPLPTLPLAYPFHKFSTFDCFSFDYGWVLSDIPHVFFVRIFIFANGE